MKKLLVFGFPHCGTTILRAIIGHIDSVETNLDEVDPLEHKDIVKNNEKSNLENNTTEITKKSYLIKLFRKYKKKLGMRGMINTHRMIPIKNKKKIKSQKNKSNSNLQKYTLYKLPFLIDINNNEYDDYIKIFIIRNPLYVFSSLNKRFDYDIPYHPDSKYDHSIDKYIKTCALFNYYKDNPTKNLYTIRYEDIFENEYKNLKVIFDSIGFEYTDIIFNNTLYINKSHNDQQLIDYNPIDIVDKPTDKEHVLYRNWQINQPFINTDNIDKIDLTDEQKNVLLNNEDILKAYPNIKEII